MTEIEKRIEEMAEDLQEVNSFRMNTYAGETWVTHDYTKTAEALIDRNYRKADEVQKETIKEIVDWLNTNTYTVAIYKKNLNAFLKEKFGVEVEE